MLGATRQIHVGRVTEATDGVMSAHSIVLLVIRETRCGWLIDPDHDAVGDVTEAGEQLQHADAADQYRHH